MDTILTYEININNNMRITPGKWVIIAVIALLEQKGQKRRFGWSVFKLNLDTRKKAKNDFLGDHA